MTREELLKEIKKEEITIATTNERLAFLKSEFYGIVSDVHTPNGMITFVKHLINTIYPLYNYEKPSVADEIMNENIRYYQHKGLCLKYGEWYINIKISDKLSTFSFEVDKFSGIANEKMVNPEKLISFWSENVKIFRDGKYIDFIVQILKKIIAKDAEVKRERALKEMIQHQHNMSSIDF